MQFTFPTTFKMPPLFIRNYVWKQNNSIIVINVPIKNVQSSRLHFFSTDEFIKINYESQIFELFLYKPVIKSKTKIVVRQNEIILELQKAEPAEWNSLQLDIPRAEIAPRIKQILQKEHENEKLRSREQKEEKEQIKKFLRNETMAMHIKEREEIEQAKDKMMNDTKKEIITWENNLKKNPEKQLVKYNTPVVVPPSIPFPRKCATISFSFTPRVFPTPKRESKSEEEKEWLRKEVEARRCTGFVVEELTEKEKDPSWLLSKGESFMNHENYLAAVNAFGYGMQLKPKMPLFYVRLAEAHLKLKNFYKAAESASQALELLQPVVEKNRQMRADAYRVRSAAFKSIGEMDLSKSDQDQANKLSKLEQI